jgi:hypothetical protein
LIIDPPDGKIPSLTPEAQKRQAAFAEYRRQHPGDGPEDFSLNNRCILWPTAGPPMLPGGYNNNYEIIQTPEYVTILVEMIHDARIIPLDGRPHLPSSVRQWMGDSRGHWEADTLVVETTNFTNKTNFRGASENMRLIERFTRTDANTIIYVTVNDPSSFTKTMDRSNSHEKNCSSAPRVRLPRRQLRDGRNAGWRSRGGEEGYRCGKKGRNAVTSD